MKCFVIDQSYIPIIRLIEVPHLAWVGPEMAWCAVHRYFERIFAHLRIVTLGQRSSALDTLGVSVETGGALMAVAGAVRAADWRRAAGRCEGSGKGGKPFSSE
ncbi:hypothetical protein B5M45_04655 [Mycobacterium simiae]|uniref:Uncharacterized protein n=1 Tax=Mycobacterium simiae TaxID=1784 RepID=A0A1X0YFF0_MYCSI|nr:hypothetical protein B5M45_04655 [Mycobacterium simiae]